MDLCYIVNGIAAKRIKKDAPSAAPRSEEDSGTGESVEQPAVLTPRHSPTSDVAAAEVPSPSADEPSQHPAGDPRHEDSARVLSASSTVRDDPDLTPSGPADASSAVSGNVIDGPSSTPQSLQDEAQDSHSQPSEPTLQARIVHEQDEPCQHAAHVQERPCAYPQREQALHVYEHQHEHEHGHGHAHEQEHEHEHERSPTRAQHIQQTQPPREPPLHYAARHEAQQTHHQPPTPGELYPRVPLEPRLHRLRPAPITVPPPLAHVSLESMASSSLYHDGLHWYAVASQRAVIADSGYVVGSALVNQHVVFHPHSPLSPPGPTPILPDGPMQASGMYPYAMPHEPAPPPPPPPPLLPPLSVPNVSSVPNPNGATVTEVKPPAPPPTQAASERILVLETRLTPTAGATTKTRQYGCTQCGRSFYRRSDLARHIQIHLGIKPNLCPFCGKAFIQRSALTVHVRVHTGEKPYTCQVCGRLFSDSSSLARHRRIHLRQQGEQPPGPRRPGPSDDGQGSLNAPPSSASHGATTAPVAPAS